MSKNAWAKTRPQDNPYVSFTHGGWQYKILKAYQSRKNEKTNKFARLFVNVISECTGPTGDTGDTYITEIPMVPAFVAALEAREKEEEQSCETSRAP